jgi:gliding motility-associated-like protein
MPIRPCYLLLLLLLFFTCCLPARAQKETNFWILGPNAALDFNHSPPRATQDIRIPGAGPAGVQAMADKDGRLLFYTDGLNVYTRTGTVMPNGGSIVSLPQGVSGKVVAHSVALVPKPGSPYEYYVFTSHTIGVVFQTYYSLVDMRLNGGLGDVARKEVGEMGWPYLTTRTIVTGNCDQSHFWVIFSSLTDRVFHAIKVDERGISPMPVISPPPSTSYNPARIIGYRMSPQGDRIMWKESDVGGFLIGDFSMETGQISNSKLVPAPVSQATLYDEFSSDGRMLYVVGEERQGEKQILQFDVGSGDPATILQSRYVVHTGKSNPVNMQLGSDGKIYVQHEGTGTEGGFLTVIHRPNSAGAASGYDPMPFLRGTSFRLPNYITSFLQEHGPSGIPARAGADAVVCQGQPHRLGDPSADPSLTYSWSPAAHLSDPSSPSPTFRYDEAVTDSAKTLTYTLTVGRGNCQNTDTVRVKVYPQPTASLSGTRSVCPRVEGAQYRVEEPVEGHSYRWQVGGGTLTSGQGTASVTVDWGPTNAQAFVEVVPVSPQGCEGPAVRLPVRINVELIPETPRGPEAVCLNQRQGITYSVTNTPGSIYTWSVEGGTLASGQGSSRVTVDWQGEGHHKLWLQEQSTTRDTVCFGVSEPLLVSVFRDRTALSLSRVSMSLEQEGAVEAFWSSSDPARTAEPLVLLRRRKGENGWQQAASLPRGSTSHQDPNLRTHEQVYEYRVEAQNGCGELIGTSAHATVLLTGEGREEDGQISLSWTGYEGWEQGVERYEVWRKLDGEEQLRLVGQVNGSTLTYSGASGLDGFDHRFRIRAIAKGTGLVSWSNELQLEFKHELTAPNIFTPNGDGYNDTFSIPLLELYPDNQLTVFSRWGQVVYQAENYRNGWTAERLSAGTYYYSLLLRRNGKLLKGWVEVLR